MALQNIARTLYVGKYQEPFADRVSLAHSGHHGTLDPPNARLPHSNREPENERRGISCLSLSFWQRTRAGDTEIPSSGKVTRGRLLFSPPSLLSMTSWGSVGR